MYLFSTKHIVRGVNAFCLGLLGKALIFGLTFCSGSLWAQSMVEGTVVTTKGEAVSGANVVVYGAKVILGYGISDSAGFYRIEYDFLGDTLVLRFSHLSFESQEKVLLRKQESEVDWMVNERTFDLPVTEVKPASVTRRGDTLVFDVGNLRELNDENLEDVLRRIPGVRIDNNGQIKYRGLPISRFYIEGMDLLEGRYALATRNLRIDAVQDIEILDQHQHIQALDSLFRPPNAALNIRLKTAIAFTGKVEIGGGVAPPLHQANAILFGFQKSHQFSVIGAANNTGNIQRDNFNNLVNTVPSHSLISPQTLRIPYGVNPMNVRNNKERTHGVNFLRKVSENDQLKVQLFGSTEQIGLAGNRLSVLKDGDLSVRFTEELHATKKSLLGNGRLIWERNTKKFYARSSVEADFHSSTTTVDNLVNLSPVKESLISPKMTIRGNADIVLRKKERAFRYKIKATYTDDDYDLRVNPVSLNLIDPIAEGKDSVWQTARQRVFQSEVYSRLFIQSKQFKPNIQVGVSWQVNKVDSQLNAGRENAVPANGLTAQNMTQREVIKPYVKQDVDWKIGKIDAQLRLPLSIYFVTTEDFIERSKRKDLFFVSDSRLSFGRKFNNGDYLALGLNLAIDYDDTQYFFGNPVLINSRRVSRGITPPNRRSQNGLDLIYKKYDAFKGVSYTGLLGINSIKLEQIYNYTFAAGGNTSSVNFNTNTTTSVQISNRFDANMGSWGLLRVDVGSAYSASPTVLNGRETVIHQHDVHLTTDLSWTFGRTVLRAQPRVKMIFNSLSAANVVQTNVDFEYFYELSKQLGDLSIVCSIYQINAGPRRLTNRLFNFRYKRENVFWKLNMGIHVNNLLNARDFVTFQQSGFSEELTYFNTRPRQVVLVLSREF